MADATRPRLFISYSWTTPDHEAWVLELAEQLCADGVDVVLDKYDLHEGDDTYAFMERMVTDPTVTKVAMICDRAYVEKADRRERGAGTETQIISAELYGKVKQSKFVAVVREVSDDGQACVPTYYKSRKYIDMSTESLATANFDQLVRWAFDKPLHVRPPIGNPPPFVSRQEADASPTRGKARQVVRSFESSQFHAPRRLREYLSEVSGSIASLRVAGVGATQAEIDEEVHARIESTIPLRRELLSVLRVAVGYGERAPVQEELLEFFDRLAPLQSPRTQPAYSHWDADAIRFLSTEVLLHCIALLLDARWFDVAGAITTGTYVRETRFSTPEAVAGVDVFSNPIDSLEARSRRLNLRRTSLAADLMKSRSEAGPISFEEIMQADFVVFLAAALRAHRESESSDWWPHSLLYQPAGTFPLFLKAASRRHFDRFSQSFGASTKSELSALLESYKSDPFARLPRWNHHILQVRRLMGWEALCTRD